MHGKGDSVGLVLTAQYTVEEYEAIISTFVNEIKTKNIFFWVNNLESFDDFDGLLIRGDKNPNTKGLLKVLEKHGITKPWGDLKAALDKGSIKTLVVAGPENQTVFPDMKDKLKDLSKAQTLIWMQACKSPELDALTGTVYQIPLKTFVEKDGTFINQQGLEQKFKRATTVVSEALTLTEAGLLLGGKNLSIPANTPVFVDGARPNYVVMQESRKKNEFVFKRGSL